MTLLSKRLFPSHFDDLFSTDFARAAHYNGGMTLPAVNISETELAFNLELAAPGMKKGDFKIELEDDVLTVSAASEKNREADEKSGRYTRREFSFMQFSRSFTLPEQVDHEAIEADYTDGVLRIAIPKKHVEPQTTSRLISIK